MPPMIEHTWMAGLGPTPVWLQDPPKGWLEIRTVTGCLLFTLGRLLCLTSCSVQFPRILDAPKVTSHITANIAHLEFMQVGSPTYSLTWWREDLDDLHVQTDSPARMVAQDATWTLSTTTTHT